MSASGEQSIVGLERCPQCGMSSAYLITAACMKPHPWHAERRKTVANPNFLANMMGAVLK